MAQSAFKPLLAEYLMPLGFGSTATGFLDSLDQPHADEMGALNQLLATNPLYCQWLENSNWDLLKKSKWAEAAEKMSASEILYLRGGAHVRDALLALRMIRMNPGELPPIGGAPTIQPDKKLLHAFELEKMAQDQRLAHERTNYRAGLVFDVLTSIFEQKKLMNAGAQGARTECWKMGLRAGQVVYQLGSDLKTFKYQKYAFASGILLFAAVWMMYVRHATSGPEGPAYKEFVDRMKKQKLYHNPEIATIFERKAYVFPSHAWASLIANFSGHFRPIEKALFFIHSPYFLRKKHPDLFRLSILLATGYQLAIDGPLTAFHKKRLTEIGVKASQLRGVTG